MSNRFSGAAITGAGIVCPLGLDLESFWNAVIEHRSCLHTGLGRFTDDDLAQLAQRSPGGLAGSRVAMLGHTAAREAMADAGWTGLDAGDGIILATTTGEILHWESALMQAFRTQDFTEFVDRGGITTPGRSLAQLKSHLNFAGPSMLIGSACSAATQALALAALWVQSGRVRRCLVGGSEVLTQLSVEGFRCLGLLSTTAPRPFDQHRAGINLSEGAAFFCVEELPSPRSRMNILGFAMNSDAYHLTAPEPEGQGSRAVIRAALESAGAEASEIDWVHAHGTGSPANDLSEGVALESLFGDRVPVTSTKGQHGHALGASGAIETALCLKAIEAQIIIGTAGCTEPDKKLRLKLQREHRSAPIKKVLKNSLGFGGINAALVLGAPAGCERAR